MAHNDLAHTDLLTHGIVGTPLWDAVLAAVCEEASLSSEDLDRGAGITILAATTEAFAARCILRVLVTPHHHVYELTAMAHQGHGDDMPQIVDVSHVSVMG